LVCFEQAKVSGTLCEPFSAQKAARLGIIADVVPALKVGGKFIANPTVVTDRMIDEYGRIVHGEFKTGAAFKEGQGLIKEGEIDLSLRCKMPSHRNGVKHHHKVAQTL